MCRKTRIPRRARRKGAATVELAIVSPLLLLFLLGIIDAGQYANTYQTISNASREGARVAARSRTNSTAEVETAVIDYLAGAFPKLSDQELASAVSVSVSNTATKLSGSDLESLLVGTAVEVGVSMNFAAVRFIPGLRQLDSRTLATSTIMRRE